MNTAFPDTYKSFQPHPPTSVCLKMFPEFIYNKYAAYESIHNTVYCEDVIKYHMKNHIKRQHITLIHTLFYILFLKALI